MDKIEKPIYIMIQIFLKSNSEDSVKITVRNFCLWGSVYMKGELLEELCFINIVPSRDLWISRSESSLISPFDALCKSL